MITDPISDMLTQIRNALLIKRADVRLPYSKLKHAIAQILVREGYLESAERVESEFGTLQLKLKYQRNEPAISNLKRVSKPGRRVYASRGELPWVLNNYGIAILSTSQGLMTNREARKKKIGGEVICEIY